MVVKSGDTVGVVEALDIVARWCVVAAPLVFFWFLDLAIVHL